MTHPANHPTERPRSHAIAAGVAIGALLLLLLALWAHRQWAERGALEDLSPPERRALYERTMHTLRTTCARPSGLDDFCREQARFVMQFPECDEACLALARPIVGEPTR